MPTSQKKNKKINKKSQLAKIPTRLIICIAVFLLIGIGIFIWKPWKGNISLPFKLESVAVIKPKMDISRARQMTIDPEKDNIMQISDNEKVLITLEVPKGALKEKTVVKMIPFYYDKNQKAPTAGVIISPSSIAFSRPVTLSFDMSSSVFKNDAPKNLKTLTLRTTGLSQVLQIDSTGTIFTPTLIARAVETEFYLPARILTGGAYVFSLDGIGQEKIARMTLEKMKQNSLATIESASSLVFNNEKLSEEELVKTQAGIEKILSKKAPPAIELYAALSLQRRLEKNQARFDIVQKAYADTSPGYLEMMCKKKDLSVTDYLTTAQTAELMGYQHIAEECKVAAKNIVAEEASKVLENPNSDIKSVLVALQRVQLIGLDEDSELDEALMNRAKVIVTKEAQKVLSDPNATAVDVAKALQRVQAIGAANDKVEGALTAKLEEYIDKEEAKLIPPEDFSEENEDLIPEFDMNVVGLAMAQALFGLESFDEEGIKNFSDKMAQNARDLGMAGEALCEAIVALGGTPPPECSGFREKAEEGARQIETEGYRAADEVGSIQERNYEDEEYGGEDPGDDELEDAGVLFDESLTPTPEEEYEYEVETSPGEDDSTPELEQETTSEEE